MAMVELSKGRVYRITNREAVQKGQYYISCTCKSCGQKLYLFPWSSTPILGTPFLGEGTISLACRHCTNDHSYSASDFSIRIAVVDLPATYTRVEPSAMPRQPLLRTKYKDAKPTFGPHSLEDRPKASALIARIIGLNSEIDASFAFLMGRMMKANTAPAMALFLSLRHSRFQADALNAVAKVTLSDEERELFGALMSLRSACDNERDALAHGRFGDSPAIETGLVWVDAFDYLQFSLRVETEDKLTDDSAQWLRERMYVYELSDLERIARDAEALYHSVTKLAGYLISDNLAWRAERLPQLCAEPHVQQAIYQLREGAKKKR